jgi:hypothetical protein
MPWGTTKGAFQRLETAAEWQGMTYADILERLEKQGVPGPRAQELATKFSHEAADRAANSGANKSVAKAFASEADNVRAVAPRDFVLLGESPPAAVQTPATPSAPPVGAPSKVPLVRDPMNGRYLPRALQPQTAPPPLVPDAIPAAPPAQPTVPVMYRKPVLGPQSPNLGLGQAERIKRALQADARYGRIEDTPVNEAKKEIASTYRQAIEDTIQQAGENAPPRSEVAQMAEEFVPVKRRLALTIAARDAAERGAARAAQRVGGAAGVNAFDVANAAQASGTTGLPAMALAAAGRVWKERGPSTLASAYNTGANEAGSLARYLQTVPTRGVVGANIGTTAARGPASEAFQEWLASKTYRTEEERVAEAQRALAEALRKQGP